MTAIRRAIAAASAPRGQPSSVVSSDLKPYCSRSLVLRAPTQVSVKSYPARIFLWREHFWKFSLTRRPNRADSHSGMEVADPAFAATAPVHRSKYPPARLGSVYVDRLPWESYVGCLADLLASGTPCRVASCRARDLMRAREDPAFRRLLLSSDLVVGTGNGMRLLSKLARAGLSTVSYTSVMARVTLTTAADHGWNVFFLGGREREVFNFAHEAPRTHPGLRIVGALEGPRLMDDDAGARRLVERINDSGADIILGSPGSAAGEAFTYAYRDELDPRLVVNLWDGFSTGFRATLMTPASTIPAFIGLAMKTIRS
jgi:UDP-N-acetyl-D-mannosaminuronic acid transferase (WecB/TagA/CpsF family)